MKCQLTVRERDLIHVWTIEEWTLYVAIAVLCDEPETSQEWAEAMRRYQPEHVLSETSMNFNDLAAARSPETPWCLIDLTSRTVVAGGGFELPEPDGAYEVSDGEIFEGFPIVWLNTPDNWTFQEVDENWQERIHQRAQVVAGQQRIKPRDILFGRPMLDHLVEEVRQAAEQQTAIDSDRQYELSRKIHARWLMTARDDLMDQTPRQWLLGQRDHIGRDIQRRSEQWTRQGHAPPSLPVESAAYQYGGFGTIEVVLYFDLMRSLLAKAWELRQQGCAKEMMLERLADHRDQWMASPPEDGSSGMSSAELIESERRRMPVTSDGSHLDCDCPICQAEADGDFGPAFMFFDGHHLEMEDEFAFSLTESQEEWEAEQLDYQAFSDEMACKEKERQELGQSDEPQSDEPQSDEPQSDEPQSDEPQSDEPQSDEPQSDEPQSDESQSTWKSSFVDWDGLDRSDMPMDMFKMAIAFPLAEIIEALKGVPEGRRHIDSLNEVFTDFRTAEDLVIRRSAADRLGQQLEAAAHDFPQIVSRSADLQSRLDEIVRKLESLAT